MQTNKTISLPAAITIAVGQYYLNRQLANKQLVSHTIRPDGTKLEEWRNGKPWNKDADLDRISESCRKHKFGYQAFAGTFWFHTSRAKTRTYLMEQSSWPLAQIQKR